jgi:hypothetical protein
MVFTIVGIWRYLSKLTPLRNFFERIASHPCILDLVLVPPIYAHSFSITKYYWDIHEPHAILFPSK